MSKRLTIEEFIQTLKSGSGSGGSSGSGALIVNLSYEGSTYTADKTWKEIYDAFVSGVSVRFIDSNHVPDNPYPVVYTIFNIYSFVNQYTIALTHDNLNFYLTATSEDEYPEYNAGD